MIPAYKTRIHEGRKGLIVGIANDRSIAWGCAMAFRALGAEVAITYRNEKTKKYVEPLARELETPIFMPLDVEAPGHMEAVFERIEKDWGELDFLVHSIAFSPKEALGGRVIDVQRDGFITTMDISCWSFIRMAHLAEPLMKNGGAIFTMTYYGSQMVVENYNIMGVAKAALESAVRYIAAELGPKGIRVHAISPGPLATRAASGIPEFVHATKRLWITTFKTRTGMLSKRARPRETAVGAHQNAHKRPTAANVGNDARHLLHRAGRGVDVRTPQFGGQQMAPAEHVERQVAVAVVIAVEEPPLLSPAEHVERQVAVAVVIDARLTAPKRFIASWLADIRGNT